MTEDEDENEEEGRIPKLLVLVGARASARFGVWMGKTLRHPMSGWRA
jgi:hypothetical protein